MIKLNINIIKKNNTKTFIKNIIYYKNIKKKNISKINLLFIKLGLLIY